MKNEKIPFFHFKFQISTSTEPSFRYALCTGTDLSLKVGISNFFGAADYIFEPSEAEIVEQLIPKSLKTQLFKAIRDSFASEHGARMTAMHKATDNFYPGRWSAFVTLLDFDASPRRATPTWRASPRATQRRNGREPVGICARDCVLAVSELQ